METRNVLVPCPLDLVAKINATPERVERVRVRKTFNESVLKDIQKFANDKGLSGEVDFTNSGVNISGVFFNCTDAFQFALEKAALPHVGNFIKDRPLSIGLPKP